MGRGASKGRIIVSSNLKGEDIELLADNLGRSLEVVLPCIVKRFSTTEKPILTVGVEREKIYVEVD